jgi:tetratricopeptide (TPR) repeat protein
LRALMASAFCFVVAGSTHLHRMIGAPSDPSRSAPGASTRMEARSEYGLARYFLDRRRAGDLDRARDRFERAIALDSSDAHAYAGLASVYWLLVVQSEMTRERGLPRVRAAAERALALDGRNAEAHLRMSRYAETIGDAAGGKEHARIAWREGPEDATVLSDEASVALAEGRLEEAVDFSRRAAVAAPVSVALRYNLAFALFVAGRYDEAREVNLSLADVDASYLTDIAAQALVMQRRFDDALALVSTWPQGAGRQEIEALAYRGLNRNAEANLALDNMIEGFRDSDPLRIVEVYAYRGDTDRAFEWLARGTDWISSGRLPGPFGGMMPWALRLSPFVASLRSDPRWIEWMNRAGST